MILVISISGTANNICSCFYYSFKKVNKALMISYRYLDNIAKSESNNADLGTYNYYRVEVLSLILGYLLIHCSGSLCLSISQKVGKPPLDKLIGGLK